MTFMLAWIRRWAHSFLCMWRGGCWLTHYRGLRPILLACTCGKLFWWSEKFLHESSEKRQIDHGQP
jgi:hypothetical protein